ncbi:MAG: MobF family relaxase, partial [Egicoccus sp.]
AAGEEPGRWIGRGAQRLELAGRVQAEQLRAVLAGHDPVSGEQLARHPARKVPGFDLTFRAPKSVSLLWGLGDRTTGAQVMAAHDAAVDAAVGYLERTAGFTRRGAGGTEQVATTGFVASAFRHRSSRAGDPLLHTHVLVANLAETVDDGVWRTLDARRLYAHAKTAGFLYQAQLRHELTVALGVGWQPPVNGAADIAGVDRNVIEAFSQRRRAIVQTLCERGEDSAKAAQVATLDTRQAKDGKVSEAQLRAGWRARAATLGVRDGESWARRLTGVARLQSPDVAALHEELVGEDGLTANASTFTRRDVVQAIASRLPTGGRVADIEAIADATLTGDRDRIVQLDTSGPRTSGDVLRRPDGTTVDATGGDPRFTTRSLVLTEHAATEAAVGRGRDGVALGDQTTVEHTIADRRLSVEQAEMVRRLTSSGRGVEVVVGRAGTGKTYTLAAAHAVWRHAGIRVTGVALAARAALELQESSGIASTTIARLLGQLDRGQPSKLAPGSVLVVDEAGMVGTRTLARLLDHAQRREVKVVLVGDHRQLPEIDAGGLFRTLIDRLDPIELTDNRRQTHAWEQQALVQLRHGDPTEAVAAYRQHGRVITDDDPDLLRDRLVSGWWHTARHDLPDSIMIALRRADVDDLNRRARQHLRIAGRLTGPALTIGEVEFQAGDRIVCLRNRPDLGVVNGTRATITHIDRNGQTLHAVDDRRVRLQLPFDYLDAGHLVHGYAVTGHKAQGITVEHTYTLGTPDLYREWGYVALSRGRTSNRLYLTSHDPAVEALHHQHTNIPDGRATTAGLRRSRAQTPVGDLADLGVRIRELERHLRHPDVQHALDLDAHRRQLDTNRRQQRQRAAAANQQLDQLPTIGLPRHRRERQWFVSEQRAAQRHAAELDRAIATLDRQLARLPDPATIRRDRERLAALTARLRDQTTRTVANYHHRPPTWLVNAIGPPPNDPQLRRRWTATAESIEDHRRRWDITHPSRALDADETIVAVRSDERRRLARNINDLRATLAIDPPRSRVIQRGLSR